MPPTTTPNPARRHLTFPTLDRVMPEVDRLLAGHTTVGNWTLGQICNHLAASVVFSIEGFPGRAPWVVRRTVGPLILRRMLRTGRFPDGLRLPDRFAPKPGPDARAEAEALRAALRLFAGHTGPVADHPLAGRVSRDVWERVHCLHCAHHLGFALPAEPGTG